MPVNQYDEHIITSDELTLYRNAYDDDTRKTGYFADVADEITRAESHVIINGWAVEDIPIGSADADPSNTNDPFQRKQLSKLLIEKAMEFDDTLEKRSVLILIQSWNHALDGGKSNEFGNALLGAARDYYQAHRVEIEKELAEKKKLLSLMEPMRKHKSYSEPVVAAKVDRKILHLNERIQMLEKIKQGDLPANLIWRANSGKNGDLTNSNHQKSVSIDGEIVFTGGLDLAFGRDYSATYHESKVIKEGEPIFRDGATKTQNRNAAQDVENSAFALALSKARRKNVISTMRPMSAKRSHSDTEISNYLAERIKEISEKRGKSENTSSSDSPATWQLLRTVPVGLMYNEAIERNLPEELGASLKHKNANKAETGIREAYLDVIQKAKNFIYIENQNFTTENIHSRKNIPRALVNKILAEHKKGNDDFHVYITLPRYPVLETDDPDSAQVQLLASAQQDTIQHLYELLKEKGIEDPSKYITFSTQIKLEGEQQAQVYNHSKLIITDGSCIQGSANISDRSMDGKRDSEHVVRINYNKDEQVKDKYMRYLFRLLASNMGEDFLINFLEENAEMLEKNGCIQRRDDGSFRVLIDKIIPLDEFRFAWHGELANNQARIENGEFGDNEHEVIPLPHTYMKSELIESYRNSPLHSPSSAELSSEDLGQTSKRKSLLYNAPDKLKKRRINESPETNRSIRAAVGKITNVHR